MPLKGVPKCLSPEILHTLSSMGHGDEIVLADAHFPTSSTAKSSTCGTLEIRADGGASLSELLTAIVKFIPLDQYDENNAILMDLVDSDKEKGVEVKIWKEYQQILNNAENHQVKLTLIPRFDFYERAKKAYAIIHSGDDAIYANIILKKGVVRD